MVLFRFISFIGAAALLVAVAPWADNISFFSRAIGAIALMWGGFYFMLRENETLYGAVCVIFAVLVQPFYLIPLSMGMWMLLAILSAGYLILCGLLYIKLEKANAEERARKHAELEMYRRNEEKLREQQSRR